MTRICAVATLAIMLVCHPSWAGAVGAVQPGHYRLADGRDVLVSYSDEPEEWLVFHLDPGVFSQAHVLSTAHLQGATRLAATPYGVLELTWRNADVELSGTLLLPASPHGGAVMVHGSGASSRSNLWYMILADRMAKSGFAVLVPDKRGAGKSAGSWEAAGFDDLAGDALGALQPVAEAAGLPANRIGLLGISQGGWIVPLAASLRPDLPFIVNVSGALVTPTRQLRHEVGADIVNAGVPRILMPAIRWFFVRRARNRQPAWWAQNGSFDPAVHWRATTTPALVVYGRQDEHDNVPVAESIEIADRLRAGGRGALELRVYEDLGHGLFDPVTGRVSADFLETLTQWLRSKMPATPSPVGQL